MKVQRIEIGQSPVTTEQLKGYIGLNGEALDDERVYTVGMTKNCMNKFKRYFGTALAEEKASLVTLSTFNDLARWMISQNGKIEVRDRGRFEIIHAEYLQKK